MTTKNFKLTIVIPNYTIASYVARFECEHPAVKFINTTTLTFPNALTIQHFLFELAKMGEIKSNPCQLIELR